MNFRRFVNKPGFALLFFAFAFIALCWPYAMMDNIMKSPELTYKILYGGWALVIFILFVASRSYAIEDQSDGS